MSVARVCQSGPPLADAAGAAGNFAGFAGVPGAFGAPTSRSIARSVSAEMVRSGLTPSEVGMIEPSQTRSVSCTAPVPSPV